MTLTFVFVERNSVTVAVKLKKMCVNVNKGRGYVMVYRSKMRHMYCKYEDNIRCDETVVLYLLPLSLLIWNMNNQWRLKLFINVAPALRTSFSWIWEWLLKQCNDSDGEYNLVINIKWWNNNRAQLNTKRYS